MQSDGAPRSFAQRLGMKAHLLVCAWCRRYGRQIRFLQRFAGPDLHHPLSPASLSSAARDRLRQAMEQSAGTDSL